MCGIAGILALPGPGAAPSRPELSDMIGTLRHRGPDGFGFYCERETGLAHARLSIIDLAGGDQPIHNEDRSVWVVFNGEIFNFIELRAGLERAGHRFYTQSDTEVIVHLYELHGDDFVQHLNGQFAIALWDTRRRRLVLARDRTGIRPLFYTEHAGRLLFASEVKALFAIPGVPRRIDPVALAETFTFWAPLQGRPVFDGVQALPPGHLLSIDAASGRRQLTCYWDWQFPEEPGAHDLRSADDLAEELRSLLIDAVRLQLRADVPVGAYLSGGLDSSVITSLIHHFTEVPLQTFSLTFEDDEFDESVHQRELAAYLGTRHAEVRCTRADIAAHFPRALWHAEVPIVRTAPTPLMLLSGLVREQGHKVVLTGEGADEVFGGYDLFKEAAVRRFMARDPDSAMRPQLLKRLYPYLRHAPGGGAFARQFFSEGLAQRHQPWFAHVPRWNTTGRIAQFFSPALREVVQGWSAHPAIEATLPPRLRRASPLAQAQYVEAHTLMSGYLLSSQGDRMAMANSIEGRFPFLDHRVIEFANRLPPRYKLMGLTEKYLLKRSMKGLLPESIRRRSKQPYRAPDSQSFFTAAGEPVEQVAALLSESSIAAAGYFDPRAVRKLVEKCRSGRAIGFGDNMAFVGVLSAMWIDHLFVRGDGLGGRAAVPPRSG